MIFSITTDDDGSIVGMSAVVPAVQPVTLILAELPPVGEPAVQHRDGENVPIFLTESELAVRRAASIEGARRGHDSGDDFHA